MKWLVVYIAVANGPETTDYCARFVSTWLTNPPGIPCDLVVACNGGPLSREQAELFLPLNALFFPRPNDEGFDITAYQDVAAKFDCDAMCCCGQSIHFHQPGWLNQYDDACAIYGVGMFGTFSSNLVRPHLNTTGFVINPNFLKAAPRPNNRKQRYDWEHGENAAWRRINYLKFPTMLVTWDGFYQPEKWRLPPNIMWRGDQSNCLMRCKWTDLWDEQDVETKARWSNGADFGGNQL